MKKIAFALLSAGIVFSSVQADNNNKEKEQKELSAEEQADENAEAFKGRQGLSGIYGLFGINLRDARHDASYDYTDRVSVEDSSNMFSLYGTVGAGIGKKFAGFPVYLSLEALLDFGQQTTGRHSDKADMVYNTGYSCTVTRNGLSPSVGIRAAWASSNLGAIIFVKIAGAHMKNTYKHTEYYNIKARDKSGNEISGANLAADLSNTVWSGKVGSETKLSKVVPEISFGGEKRWGRMGLRGEIVYRLPHGDKEAQAVGGSDDFYTKRQADLTAFNETQTAGGKTDADTQQANLEQTLDNYLPGVNEKIRLKDKGSFGFRLLCTWNLNLFN